MSYLFEEQELNQIDSEIAASPDIQGAECNSCFRLLAFKYFRKMTNMRTGHSPQCIHCEAQPVLSMEEHVSRLKEANLNSAAVRGQRHEDQEEFRLSRRGRTMHGAELLSRLHRLVPNLHVKQGGIAGDVALYLVAPGIRRDWDNKNYRYMGFVTLSTLPEYSSYEFDEQRDVMTREKERGWRTVLLRFIVAGVLTEEQCNREFGKAVGRESSVWHKTLWKQRNNTTPNPEP